MLSIFLNLLRIFLWSNMLPCRKICACLRRVCILSLMDGMFCMYLFGPLGLMWSFVVSHYYGFIIYFFPQILSSLYFISWYYNVGFMHIYNCTFNYWAHLSFENVILFLFYSFSLKTIFDLM
jgi:hypothetical protein